MGFLFGFLGFLCAVGLSAGLLRRADCQAFYSKSSEAQEQELSGVLCSPKSPSGVSSEAAQ